MRTLRLVAVLVAVGIALLGCQDPQYGATSSTAAPPASSADSAPPSAAPTPPVTTTLAASSPASSKPPASSRPTTVPPQPTTSSGSAKPRWTPAPGSSWQWQLTVPVDLSVDAQIYDIDGEGNDASVVSALHAKGRKVICYVNVGASEDFRTDRGRFPAAVQGAENGWPGERWLDIRRLDLLLPIMAARFDRCRDRGFDGIEADLADGYAQQTGFPLSAADQLGYNRALAGLAHDRGLAIGLKNDLDQIPDLVGLFDFAVNEQCAQYSECHRLAPFIKAGKAVLHAEYEVPNDRFCPQTTALGLSSIRKNLALDPPRWPCR